jgi:hypothetical protein
MPIPYRRTPRAAEIGQAAFFDVVWSEEDRALYGGMLIIDGKGQPLEFVHNSAAAPSGFLWDEETIRAHGIAQVTHSLFDGCRREPDLLVCPASLASPEFCRTELAPTLPFAQVVPETETTPAEWGWVNEPPTSGMRASVIAEELLRRGMVIEPFVRLRLALRVVYPTARWPETSDGIL